MDSVEIRDLRAMSRIGTLPHERETQQELILHVELFGDFRRAGRSDDFRDTFDYSEAESCVMNILQTTSFHLLEALAESIGEALLRFQGVERVRVCIEKPAASKYGARIRVKLERPFPV